MLALLVALTPFTLAHDEQPDETGCPQCLYEDLAAEQDEAEPERGPDTDWDLFGSAGMVFFSDGVSSPWAMAGIEGWRGLYLRGEGRVHPSQKWMGRVSTGIDFLPRQEGIDITVGVYAGNAAVWNTRDTRTTQVGTELSLALHMDRTHVRVRLLGGPSSSTGLLRRETIWSLGYRLLKPIELQAQAVTLNPGSLGGRKSTGLGVAGSLIF
jgi:hypothetical protein